MNSIVCLYCSDYQLRPLGVIEKYSQNSGDKQGLYSAMTSNHVQLLYYSNVFPFVTANEVAKILGQAKKNNARDGLTGLLCCDTRIFLQVLEGPRVAVSDTLRRIIDDERHTDVVIVSCEPITERLFGNWSMMLVGSDQITEEICMRFCNEKKLSPEKMSASDLMKFAINIHSCFSDEALT